MAPVARQPYHVRLSVSQYGENFRAELFTEDLGDTEGDLQPLQWESLSEWLPYLAQGSADLPPEAARQLGREMFTALLGHAENARKWEEILGQAARQDRPVRLLIDASTDQVRDLPYGLLCDPLEDHYIFRAAGNRPRVQFARILRRATPRPMTLGTPPRVLVAVAEPRSADIPGFAAATRLRQLGVALSAIADVTLVGPGGGIAWRSVAAGGSAPDEAALAPYVVATRDALRQALQGGTYDVVHLLAHGADGAVILCDAAGGRAEVTAAELADWCAGHVQLAFLQVCKAAQSQGRGGYGGLAQQLLNPRGGDLSVVVASTFPVDAEHSTKAACDFYRSLLGGSPPDVALGRECAEAEWAWAFLELWVRPAALGGTSNRGAFQFVSPYRGLGSFTERDAELFFGRDAEIAELLHILNDERVAAVVGDSGSGKSSLLQAGLITAVRQRGLAGRTGWGVYYLRPKDTPASTLYSALLPDEVLQEPPSRKQLVDALLGAKGPVLIVLDQFEEVFTLGHGPEHAAQVAALAEALAAALNARPDTFRLVLGMRSEYLGQVAALPGLVRLVKRPWVLRPPSADNLRSIISEPATRCGYTFEGPLEATADRPAQPALLQRILADPLLATRGAAAGEKHHSSPLPLLQFALERLWLKSMERGDATFRHADYDAIGGLTGAIAQHADSVYESLGTRGDLGPQARRQAEQIITGLVSHRGTRRPRERGELLEETGDPTAARPVLDLLIAERLLTVRSDDADLSAATVDLAHESLLVHWERLKRWLAEDPQGRALREEFRRDLERWERGVPNVPARSKRLLPGVDAAGDYVNWIDAHHPTLSGTEAAFADALRHQIRRVALRRRVVVAGLAGLTAIAVTFGILALNAAGKARDAERQAVLEAVSLRLEQAIDQCEQHHARNGLLAMVDGLRSCPTDATDLRRAYLTNLAAWLPTLTQLTGVKTLPATLALAASDHGRAALVIAPNGEVRVLNTATGQPFGPPLMLKSGRVFIRGAVSLDHSRAVVVHGNHSTLWDVATGKQLGEAITHEQEITETLFSPNGKLIASVSRDGTARVVSASDGRAQLPPLVCDWPLFDMSFSNDSRYLVVGGGSLVQERRHGPGSSPTGAGDHGGAYLFDLATGKVRNRIHTADVVRCVALSPDSKTVATGNYNLRFWDVSVEGKAPYFPQHFRETERTYWLTFHPTDPNYLLVSTLLGTVRLVHLGSAAAQPPSGLPPQGTLAGTGFAADGQTIYTLSTTGTYRTWKPPLAGPQALLARLKHDSYVMCTAYHPDGHLLVVGTADGKIHLWKLNELGRGGRVEATKQITLELPPTPGEDAPRPGSVQTTSTVRGESATRQVTHVRSVIAVRFLGENGRYLAATDIVGKVDLWDLTASPLRRVEVEKMNKDWEGLCTVSRDGRAVVVHRRDSTLQVWDLVSNYALGPAFAVPNGYGREIGGFYDDQDSLHFDEVCLSPDLKLVATINHFGQVQVWNVQNATPVGPLLTHQARDSTTPEAIRQVCFDPENGNTLLTRSAGSVRLWDPLTGQQQSQVQLGLGVEWAAYSHDGRRLLLGTDSSLARVWDIFSAAQVQKPFVHRARLWGIAHSPVAEMLLTAADDRTARFWDIAAGKPLGPALHHDRGVSSAAFSPDGARCVTGSWDNFARLWAVPRPLPDNVAYLATTIEALTGLQTLPGGKTALLNETEWSARMAQLSPGDGGADPAPRKTVPQHKTEQGRKK